MLRELFIVISSVIAIASLAIVGKKIKKIEESNTRIYMLINAIYLKMKQDEPK